MDTGTTLIVVFPEAKATFEEPKNQFTTSSRLHAVEVSVALPPVLGQIVGVLLLIVSDEAKEIDFEPKYHSLSEIFIVSTSLVLFFFVGSSFPKALKRKKKHNRSKIVFFIILKFIYLFFLDISLNLNLLEDKINSPLSY